jgi:transcriptional regulator with XRE-family HTH domain
MSTRLQRRLGKAIRRLRQLAGFSQERFADEVAVHRTTMGRLERGDFNVTLETLERLARGLKMSVSSLLAEAEGEARERRGSRIPDPGTAAAESRDDDGASPAVRR